MANEFGGDRMWGLKELPLPEPVSLAPATAGWVVVGGLLLAVASWLLWRRLQRRRREHYRREALARLEDIASQREPLAELPVVLRATALAAFPRSEVASLRGSAWVTWLNDHGGRFDPSDAPSLDALPYDPALASDLPPHVASRLLATSRAWVKEHHAER